MALTGMRIGEVMAMRWKHLDWEEGQYHVRERLYARKFDTPKSRTSRRSVDLAPVVIDALRQYRAGQSALKLRMGKAYQDQDLIFAKEDGDPMHHWRGFRKALTDALAAADCPTIQIHGLRHTYAALLIAQGESPEYIKRQLGQKRHCCYVYTWQYIIVNTCFTASGT